MSHVGSSPQIPSMRHARCQNSYSVAPSYLCSLAYSWNSHTLRLCFKCKRILNLILQTNDSNFETWQREREYTIRDTEGNGGRAGDCWITDTGRRGLVLLAACVCVYESDCVSVCVWVYVELPSFRAAVELKSRAGLEVIKRGGEIKKEFSKSWIKENLLHFKQVMWQTKH